MISKGDCPFHISFAVWNAKEAFGMCTVVASYGAK